MKAYMFPGQGSQVKGMGGKLFDEFQSLTDNASEILGYSIKELCLEDPKKVLNQTQYTQPALYVVNALSYFKKTAEAGKMPDYVLGHSLGEYNALLAAEVYSFEDGLRLVKKRGELMSQATGGGMAAIVNSNEAEIRQKLQDNGLHNVDLANFNSPSQIVISGLKEEIEQAQHVFQQGNTLFYPLNTSGAFHSRFMLAARDEFANFLQQFTLSAPKIPVIANVTARPYDDNELAMILANQINHSVRWSDSIHYLMTVGEITFEEVGHGDVLTKMVQRIRRELKNVPLPSVAKQEQLQTLVSANEPDSFKQARERVASWNLQHPIGTKVKSLTSDYPELETRTEAMVLFGHRAVVYMKSYNGYFSLDEVLPV